MPDARQKISRRSAALLLAGGLAGVVLGGPALAATTKDAAHAAQPPLIASWAAALEQRALEIQNAPKAPATRIGYGAVVKKGDGGMVESVAPAMDVPSAEVQAQAPTLPGIAPIEPAPPVVITVRSPLADRVGKLSRRLIELGLLPADKWTDSFNDDVEAAVRAFQTTEGLQPDGKVGEVTRQALDRTPAQTVALLRRAAAAMRAQQASIPDTSILVNLPGQSVTLIEHGRPTFTMRAVVGRPSRKTPLLQDKVTSVTINPTWTVPPTVLSEDKLPALRKKGTTGIKNAVVYLDGAEVASTQSVNWWSVDPGRVRIVQKPGDDNALGRFRFNLTNGDGIFLHGTNDPRLFSRDLRAASSGCVRLEDARLMAETLLGAAKVTPAGIGQQLDTGDTKTIRLPVAIPVRFVYWNASVDTAGVVRVHPDIYEDPPTLATPSGQSGSAAPAMSANPGANPAGANPVTPVSTPRPLSKPAPLPVPTAHAPTPLSSASTPAPAKPLPMATGM
ncbi:L,D-transpeptidase family protein [Azospirillum sp. B510]|uniref:L,D-transpeptidase family protein n=1 Tax=Azospirillum sp. (strain B510) TaxID=137722 RepID=UPI00031E9F3C|nr:L,D-transpeptidase family protein [Azospirillum sp. B510]